MGEEQLPQAVTMGPELLIHQISNLNLKTFGLLLAPPVERWTVERWLRKCSQVEGEERVRQTI